MRVSRHRSHVRHHDLLHRPGHLREMAQRLFADRADRMGPLCGGGDDRDDRVASAVAARHIAFEASSTTAVAFRAAVLFDEREHDRGPKVAAVGDRDDLLSHAGPGCASCGTCAGRKGGRGAHDCNRARVSRRGDRDASGTAAFQPIVLIAVAGVVCNAGYVLATRKLAGADAPQTTLVWTQIAGLVFLTPILPWVWKQPGSVGAWVIMAAMGVFGATSHGMLIVAHRFAPAPTLTPFTYTQLIWMIVSGVLVFGDWPAASTLLGAALVVACGAYLALRERRGRRVVRTLTVDAER